MTYLARNKKGGFAPPIIKATGSGRAWYECQNCRWGKTIFTLLGGLVKFMAIFYIITARSEL